MVMDAQAMENRVPVILALMDGKPGHESQTEGVLRCLPDFEAERVRIRWRSKQHDNALRAAVLLRRAVGLKRLAAALRHALQPESYAELASVSHADIALSTGSSVAAPNLIASRLLGAKSVVCMRPSPLGVRPFDAAALPFHERGSGRVIRTLGAPNRISPEIVDEMSARIDDPICVGLLFGGNDRRYVWSAQAAERTAQAVVHSARQNGMRAAAATSRRTPPEAEAAIRRVLDESGLCVYAAYAGDPEPKPMAALNVLARSAWTAVTVDSFSMVCEAASSGRPAVVVEIPSRRRDRYAPTYAAVAEKTGMGRVSIDALADWTPPAQTTALRDAETAAEGVRRLLQTGDAAC